MLLRKVLLDMRLRTAFGFGEIHPWIAWPRILTSVSLPWKRRPVSVIVTRATIPPPPTTTTILLLLVPFPICNINSDRVGANPFPNGAATRLSRLDEEGGGGAGGGGENGRAPGWKPMFTSERSRQESLALHERGDDDEEEDEKEGAIEF